MSKPVALQRYEARLRAIGCIVGLLGFRAECSGSVELHHPRDGVGAAQKNSDWVQVPCCWMHHQGELGIHRRKSFYARTKMDEWDLVGATIERLNS